jgi:excisionase family DNA binding protein
MKMLDTKQAAKRLGVTISQVTLLIRQGKLPAEKFGRDWMIHPSDIDNLEPRLKTGRPVGTKNKKSSKS